MVKLRSEGNMVKLRKEGECCSGERKGHGEVENGKKLVRLRSERNWLLRSEGKWRRGDRNETGEVEIGRELVKLRTEAKSRSGGTQGKW